MDVLNKIHRAGRGLGRVCSVAQVLTALTTAVGCVALALSFLDFDFPQRFLENTAGSGFVHLIGELPFLDELPAGSRLSIQLFTFVLAQAFILLMVRRLRWLASRLSDIEHPFRRETAQKIRGTLWWVALLSLWNIVAGLMLVLVLLLLSYLVDYGAYLQEKADETQRIQEQLIMQFAEVTENKSGQTGSHIKRVSEYTRVLAEGMGLDAEEVERLRLASTMHDIGKLLVPNEILEKPGRLTDEEYAVIKQHTIYGGQLLQNVDGDVMRLSRTIALDHHERWDGHGYAQGLEGEGISLAGRIVAVADVYDALTSRRSYKDAWDERDAYNEIVRCSGTQFDPVVVEAFVAQHNEIDAIRRRYQDEA